MRIWTTRSLIKLFRSQKDITIEVRGHQSSDKYKYKYKAEVDRKMSASQHKQDRDSNILQAETKKTPFFVQISFVVNKAAIKHSHTNDSDRKE